MFEKRKKTLRDLRCGPVPPIGSMEDVSLQKFLDGAKAYAAETGISYHAYLNWAIETLLYSLEADSAARIFIPKTDTVSFDPEELFPFSAVPSYTNEKVSLEKAYIIAPLWNNVAVCRALADTASGWLPDKADRPMGYYIADIGLAVICGGVHHMYFSQLWKRGAACLKTASLADMADVIRTDGENWYVKEDDGEESWYPVQEPRMAAIYSMALERLGIE